MASVTLIGLDIGSASIRAAETRHDRNGATVTRFARSPLPPGAVQGGVVQDDKAVTGALKQLWAASRFRGRHVVLGVTNRQVVVREMAVTSLPPRELRASLPYQVRHVLPLPVEQAVLDFHPLGDPDGAKTVRGLLVAAPKEPVLQAVHATERAGLHVSRVDLASFALLRAVATLDGQVEAIVDIGAQATTVIVHCDGEPLIVRTVPRGGDEITELIANRLDTPVAEAEALKRRVGLDPGEEAGDQADGAAVRSAVRDAVRPLVNEVRSSFAYLSAGEQQARRVARLALSGGGSALPGLPEALREDLGVDVTLADPLSRLRGTARGVDDSLEGCRSAATVSIGLTLGAA